MDGEAGGFRHQLDSSQALARAKRLQVDRSYRDRHGWFFVEGVRNFVEALGHSYLPCAVIYSERLLIHPLARKLVRRLKREGVPFARVSPEQFRSISNTEHASGVGAILPQRFQKPDRALARNGCCWIALGRVRSPGNFGSLIRSSAAAGAKGFLLLDDGTDPYDPCVVRAAMGTLFRQSMTRTTASELRNWATMHRVPIVGASPDGAQCFDRFPFPRPVIIVLGTERSGLTTEQRRICDHLVRIPMAGGMDSLNLAVAGSLILYQALSTES